MRPLPEQYWIDLGENVIGQDVLRDGHLARQATTYQGIVDWILAQRITDVFDVGCNIAALAVFLKAAGFEGHYFGVDTNPHAVAFANRHSHADVASIRSLPWPTRCFECVVVKDVVEHLEGPELLAEAFRVARQHVVVATYLPWTTALAAITRHPDGYYTNRYSWRDTVPIIEAWGFRLNGVMSLEESNGTRNQVSCWKRD